MKFERRTFLKAASTGLVMGCTIPRRTLGRESEDRVDGELQAGTGTLRLEGKLKSGMLKLEAQDFIDRADRSLVINGSLETNKLYSAMFSYQRDLTAFALFNDGNHSTTITLSNSEDAKIGRLVFWHDDGTPQVVKIQKSQVLAKDSLKDFADIDGKTLDLLGQRKDPMFTWIELEKVFGSDAALLAFSRGRRSNHHPRENDLLEWICKLLSMIPGSLLGLSWLGRG
jgi:hypothetical protein